MSSSSAAAPTGLMVGLLAHPEKAARPLPTGRPRFTWIPPYPTQGAYQIEVADTAGNVVWDSGRETSDQSVAVPLGGKVPLPEGNWSWRLRVWGATPNEGPSPWSDRQAFATGPQDAPETGIYEEAGVRSTVARYRLESVPVSPIRVAHPEAGRAFLDFGRAAFAGLTLTLTAARDGETVTVHLGEAADGDAVRRKPGGSVRHHEIVVTLRAGSHAYDVPLGPKDDRRMPPNIGPVMPFRYVEIENLHAPLSADDAVQRVARYPFDADAAHFASSAPALDAVWELSRYTIEATTFCGVYVDGDRERLPYEADAYINMLGHYAADREFTLARHSQEHLIQRPTWPTEWFLFSVLCAWEDYLHTGDPDSLAAFYDNLAAKSLYALVRPDGLISTVEPPAPPEVMAAVLHLPTTRKIEDIVDWPPVERDGYDMRPVNTVINAFFCHALDRMALIAAALGKTTEAALWRHRADKATEALNSLLFDADAGLYRDGIESHHHSLHASMFPLAFGLVPGGRIPRIAVSLITKGMVCSVYGAQFLLDALYEAGRGDAALALLTAAGDRGWRHMHDTVGSTMTLEAWDAKYKPNLDWNHAWGAAPANLVPRRLLGVRPTEPGFRRVDIRPQPGRLAHAEGIVPTVRGPIRVALDAGDPKRFRLDITLPPNLTADIWTPVPQSIAENPTRTAAAHLLVNGRQTAAPAAHLGDTAFLRLTDVRGGRAYRLEAIAA